MYGGKLLPENWLSGLNLRNVPERRRVAHSNCPWEHLRAIDSDADVLELVVSDWVSLSPEKYTEKCGDGRHRPSSREAAKASYRWPVECAMIKP